MLLPRLLVLAAAVVAAPREDTRNVASNPCPENGQKLQGSHPCIQDDQRIHFVDKPNPPEYQNHKPVISDQESSSNIYNQNNKQPNAYENDQSIYNSYNKPVSSVTTENNLAQSNYQNSVNNNQGSNSYGQNNDYHQNGQTQLPNSYQGNSFTPNNDNQGTNYQSIPQSSSYEQRPSKAHTYDQPSGQRYEPEYNYTAPLYVKEPFRTFPLIRPHEYEYEEPKVRYDGAQVWNVDINGDAKLRIVGELSRSQDIVSWGGSHESADFMIKPDKLEKVGTILRHGGVRYDVVIDDVQRYIEDENPKFPEDEIDLQNRQGHRMTWKSYHRLSDIHGYLDYLAKTYPHICSVMSIGKSHMSRDLKMLRISNGNPSNKAVLIDGGIHAREWISPATVTYLINEIIENYDGESHTFKNLDWYIIPVLNPDGYEYTHTSDRLWRKNRSSSFSSCGGIDLNRNFGYKWGGKGTSKNPCSEIYAGTGAFSEPESRALRDFVINQGRDLNNNSKFKLYATYHSYGEYILYPWGYDAALPEDHADLERVGQQAAQAIVKAGGSRYKVGASSVVLYPAAGGSDDWAKAMPKIKYTYTIELSDKGRYGFLLPASYITKVGKESLAALRVMADAAIQA